MTLVRSVYPHCLGCHNASSNSCWWPDVKHYCEEYWRENISASDSCLLAFYTAQHTVLCCSDCSEESTASIFRVTKQAQNDRRISVDYMCGFDRIWLITIMEGKERSDLVLSTQEITIPKTDHSRTSTNGRFENSRTSGRLAVLSNALYSCGHR